MTNCVMSNHFDVLVRVPEPEQISDTELMRRYKVLYSQTNEISDCFDKGNGGEVAGRW